MLRLVLFSLLLLVENFHHVPADRITQEEVLDHKNTDELFTQSFEDNNNTSTILNEQLLLMNKILKSIEVIAENSNTIRNTLQKEQPIYIESCDEAASSGVYKLLLDTSPEPHEVFCEARAYGGDWTVIQQRLDGSVDFNRSWTEYRDGFGTVGKGTEFWLGLEVIRQIVQGSSHELMIELRDEQGRYGFARYRKFKIDGENGTYAITKLAGYEGTIGDSLVTSKFFKFSTYDRENDKEWDTNCAQKYAGGWWFFQCDRVTLNGPFIKDASTDRGIFWDGWTKAATYSRMMIREKS